MVRSNLSALDGTNYLASEAPLSNLLRGGIISLTALFENLVERVVMVELDDEIAGAPEASCQLRPLKSLANRILAFNLTKETVIQEITKTPKTQREGHSRQF